MSFLLQDPIRDRLEPCLAEALSAKTVRIMHAALLTGGAIQENWAIDLEVDGGPHAGTVQAVLRTDSQTGVAVSHGRVQEFHLLQAAWQAGVTVPEPLACVSDTAILGKSFCLMRRVGGTAMGHVLTRPGFIEDGEALAERLGREMARIHSITPQSHEFDFLPSPPVDAAQAELTLMQGFLADMDHDRPVLEWAFRWLQRHKPKPGDSVLAHQDFRTGNYMVAQGELTAILDWEFAGWSDRHQDIGWFHAMCWRFAGRDKPAGGIGSREAFQRGYETESGQSIDPDKTYYWEVAAHLRWAVIALQQGDRYRIGGERTLDLGLTGRRPAELELEILKMTAPTGAVA